MDFSDEKSPIHFSTSLKFARMISKQDFAQDVYDNWTYRLHLPRYSKSQAFYRNTTLQVMALSNRLLSRSLFGARSVFPLTITTRFKINDLGDDAQLAYQKKREIEEKKKQEKNKNLQLKKVC